MHCKFIFHPKIDTRKWYKLRESLLVSYLDSCFKLINPSFILHMMRCSVLMEFGMIEPTIDSESIQRMDQIIKHTYR